MTVTLDKSESVSLCIVNADYYVTSGDVSLKFKDCGCECESTCKAYTVLALKGTATVVFQQCVGGTIFANVDNGTVGKFCVDGILSPISGDPEIFLSSPCGCCPEATCWTWTVYNPEETTNSFTTKDCTGAPVTLYVMGEETLTFCSEAFVVPEWEGNLSFEIIDSCKCNIV